ncbi:hypothetical protein V492_08216, partial [Pseudogymnoascus sp. VKM F-4246]
MADTIKNVIVIG